MAKNTAQYALSPRSYSPDAVYGSLIASKDLDESLSGWFAGDVSTR